MRQVAEHGVPLRRFQALPASEQERIVAEMQRAQWED